MAHFFVNNYAHTNGNHEVHALGCVRMPGDKQYLGNFSSASEALTEARKDFWNSSTCPACAREFGFGTGAFGADKRAATQLPLRFR